MPQKRQLLIELLKDVSLNRVIVFTRTKHGANRVAETLAKTGVAAEAIHGNKSQNAMLRDIERVIRMKIEAVAHDLPDLTPEQLKAQEERSSRPHGHRHGKPHGHKGGGHKPGGGHKGGGHGGHRDGAHAEAGHNPHAPKKRNGSRPFWKRGSDKKRGTAA